MILMMKTIQIAIDETLLASVDRAVHELDINRSLFIQRALHSALYNHIIKKMEERHAAGCAQHPPHENETPEWVNEQA
jgi:metal-responsive CopG/Arc/MetJ family transcriptional regulator